MYGYSYDAAKRKYYRIPPDQPQTAKIINKSPLTEMPLKSYTSWISRLRHREINGTISYNFDDLYTWTKLVRLNDQRPKPVFNLSNKSIARFNCFPDGIVMLHVNNDSQHISLLQQQQNGEFSIVPIKNFYFRNPNVYSYSNHENADNYCSYVFVLGHHTRVGNQIELINIATDVNWMHAEIIGRGMYNLLNDTLFCLQPTPTKYRIGKECGITICSKDCNFSTNFMSPDNSEVFAIANIPGEHDQFICATRLGRIALYDERLFRGKALDFKGIKYRGLRSLVISSRRMVFGGTMAGKVVSIDLSNPSANVMPMDCLFSNTEAECKLRFDNTERFLYTISGKENITVYNINTGEIESIFLPGCNNYSPLLNLENGINGVIYEDKHQVVNILQPP